GELGGTEADAGAEPRREVAVLAALDLDRVVEPEEVALERPLTLEVQGAVEGLVDAAEPEAGDRLARRAGVDRADPERARVSLEAADDGRQNVAPVDAARGEGVLRVEQGRVAALLDVDVEVDVDLVLLRIGVGGPCQRGHERDDERGDAAHAAQSSA